MNYIKNVAVSIIVFTIIILPFNSCFAQSNSDFTIAAADSSGFIKYYQNNTINLSLDFWGNYQVLSNGKSYSTSKIRDLGHKYPSVLQEYNTYCKKKMTSYCLIATGVGLFVVGVKLSQMNDNNSYGNIGFGACMTSMIVSIYYYNSSYNNLSNSIWLYNQEILKSYPVSSNNSICK